MEPLKLITKPESWAKEAQPTVIKMLEDLLERARAGEVVAVAFAGECSDGFVLTGFTVPRHYGLMIGGLAQMQYRMNKDFDENT